MRISPQTLNRIITSEIRSLMESKKRVTRGKGRPSLYSALFEDADPGKIDPNRFPLELGSVNIDSAKKFVSGGLNDGDKKDDVISAKVNASLGTVKDLKPSQTSMNLGKAWSFALSMINGTMPGSDGPGGNLDAFVSSDNYIMDGHHRWIASWMVDPVAEMKGHKVNMPGEKLVAVLNAVTKGLHGIEKGNPSTGGFDQFKDKQKMTDACKAGIEAGPINGNVEDLKKKLKDWTGTQDDAGLVDATVEKVMDNLSSLPSDIMPNAPSRENMPVIDDKKTSGATKKTLMALAGGQIDVNPPYASEEGEEGDKPKTAQNSGRLRGGEVMVERWQRLAGLVR